ncbi:hypothetical protein KP509_26G053300 [Ceratopteris richardii]|uniref:Major facilitator superfamily (MFS) profile domain-containing protein n=1 Tax=Ceratopteris richardii TaxID=49495 RepID=A0A8T2RN43_CERRI|nr:hypothetical protein KP509_26G053300 [Ceratopteris richardii]
MDRPSSSRHSDRGMQACHSTATKDISYNPVLHETEMNAKGISPTGNDIDFSVLEPTTRDYVVTVPPFRHLSVHDPRHPAESTNFPLPVDSEFKAKKVNLLSLSQPFMRSFHVSWFAFFICFVSSFAAAPLLPVIRDDLDLRKEDVGMAGIASVCGAIASRLLMGFACDIIGPRYAGACAILLTAPAVFCMATVSTATGFILCRFFIGLSLATFVTCQFWMSCMFNSSIVGVVTGITSGCGNMGGGAAQILMPLLFNLISSQRFFGSARFTAWRISFFIPGTIQVIMGILMLTCTQDTPAGNFQKLRKSGNRIKDSYFKVIIHGVKNYRTWVLGMLYGFCFGVELTIDNVIAEYFFDKFNLSLFLAGVVASTFGLANFITRPFGGALSDFVASRYGMRGRLWTLWTLQTIGGVFCIILPFMGSLGLAMAALLIFAIFCEGAGGATTSVIPFVSRRSLGLVSGIAGAGGNAGAMVIQLLFFSSPNISINRGLISTGILSICCTVVASTLYFPQWGGMLCGPSKSIDATEESYYRREWSSEEESKGMHIASVKFAHNSRGERGRMKMSLDGKQIMPSQTRVASVETPPHANIVTTS